MRRRYSALSIRAWIDYECSTSIAKFTPVTTIFFLLNKICDGGSSKEPILKAATLSILIWAYPSETKTNNGNFKNAAILPSKVAYRWRACALILPLCRSNHKSAEHAHSFCRCVVKLYCVLSCPLRCFEGLGTFLSSQCFCCCCFVFLFYFFAHHHPLLPSTWTPETV